MRLFFMLLIAITVLTNCSRRKPKELKSVVVYFNNAEIDEWVSTQTIKPSENAHSGKYVSVIDTINPYSLGITKALKDISSKKIDSVMFTYWVLMKNRNANVKTVFCIEEPGGKNIHWVGNAINDKITEANKWIEIKEIFKMPDSTPPENILKLFVWNTSTDEVLLDDFNITFY